METDNKPWEIRALGDLSPKEKAEFYESIIEEDSADHLFSSKSNSQLYENPRLEVGIFNEDGTITPAELHQRNEGLLKDTALDIFLERYYTFAMPGNFFDLQLAISSRHLFDDRITPEQISHTLVVKGVLGDFTNYLSEPVFRNLKISDMLTLDIAVTFLTDRSTERLVKCLKDKNLQKGIELVSTYNPVFSTAATFVKGIVESLGTAKKNKPITDAHITFVSSPDNLSIPLIEGNYLLFQPSSVKNDLTLLDLYYDKHEKKVMRGNEEFQYNYMILRVKKH